MSDETAVGRMDRAVDAIRAAGVGIFRYHRETGLLALGGPDGDETYYCGICIEPGEEVSWVVCLDTEFTYPSDDHDTLRRVFEFVFDALLDEDTEVDSLEWDDERQAWSSAVVKGCDDLVDLVRKIQDAFQHGLWFDVTTE
ncbi:MAG: hypothetical protein ABIK09_04505 [Pseudomonadota bacterium]